MIGSDYNKNNNEIYLLKNGSRYEYGRELNLGTNNY